VDLRRQKLSTAAPLRVLLVLSLSAPPLVLAPGVADSATAQGTIEGASQAVCTPSPCLAPAGYTSYSLASVENGDGTTSPREYAVYRPLNLTSSPTNLTPAVLVFYVKGSCGLNPTGRFASLAPQERFVVVYMEVPCGRDDNWDKRNVDPGTSTAVNDEPYVTAVVNAITQCPAADAGPNQCIDPQRIYAAGTSSGGNMVADVMCDTQNSPLFRGYLIDSSSLQLFEGAPACPSPNRNFFVMMALSDHSIDAKLYYDEDVNPHLDVPAFADWAAARLGCANQRVDDAIGQPVASTLRYTYSGPCAFAAADSRAVVTLGVQNGGHAWVCQDSDPGAQPNECPQNEGEFDPPTLTSAGVPDTNGLFVESQFWDFVAHSISLPPPPPPIEPPPSSEPPPSPISSALPTNVFPTTTVPAPASVLAPSFVALGDGYASGEGNAHYLPGSDTAINRCDRSTVSYPYMASALLSAGPAGLAFEACDGARIADLYRRNHRNSESAQLSAIGSATRLVTISVGQTDARLPAALRNCMSRPAGCQRRWRRRAAKALDTTGALLYRLYGDIVARAPHALVLVVGYPRPFAVGAQASCGAVGSERRIARRAAEWVNSYVRHLDEAIQRAAGRAHVTYLRASYGAFAGHELCTRRPAFNPQLAPNGRGQVLLAKLVEQGAARS
jgi:poly(3-hydroxybutyrate) depolymerase